MKTALSPVVCNSVLRLQHEKAVGTGFFFMHCGEILFATCYHLAGLNLSRSNPIQFWKNGKFNELGMEWYCQLADHDALIIKPHANLCRHLVTPLLIQPSNSMNIGAWAKFPGFPRMPFVYEPAEWPRRKGDHLSGYAIPTIKKANLSFIYPNKSLVLFDGHNNLGFSGSPILDEDTDNVYAIVRGFIVNDQGNNTGFIMAHRIGPILKDLETAHRF